MKPILYLILSSILIGALAFTINIFDDDASGVMKIKIEHKYDAPISTVFNKLEDHVEFGKMFNLDVKRIKDGNQNANGVGSVRRVPSLFNTFYDETILDYKLNEMIVYSVTNGSPVKNHRGVISFNNLGNGTLVTWNIEFESKYPIPYSGLYIMKKIEEGLIWGLGNLEIIIKDEIESSKEPVISMVD
jgi:hypothetical protein